MKAIISALVAVAFFAAVAAPASAWDAKSFFEELDRSSM